MYVTIALYSSFVEGNYFINLFSIQIMLDAVRFVMYTS